MAKRTTMEKLVLVVDDEAVDRDAVKSHLEQQGYEVMTAAGGLEALQQIEARCPRVVILDLGLPDTDGFEVAKTIRTNAEQCNPALMLIHPTYPPDTEVFRGFALGSDWQGYKPVRLDELGTFVARIFDCWERYGRP
jgi:two-component system response regulator VicR